MAVREWLRAFRPLHHVNKQMYGALSILKQVGMTDLDGYEVRTVSIGMFSPQTARVLQK